jgi:hypothetical protein
MTEYNYDIAQMCISDLQGRVEAGKLQVFEDCIENMKAQAARIEELEAAIDSIEHPHGLTSNGNLWRFWSEKARQQAEDIAELEGKLEKALEALKRISKGDFAGQMLLSWPPQDAGAHFARMTLATIKLKGSKHERI